MNRYGNSWLVVLDLYVAGITQRLDVFSRPVIVVPDLPVFLCERTLTPRTRMRSFELRLLLDRQGQHYAISA